MYTDMKALYMIRTACTVYDSCDSVAPTAVLFLHCHPYKWGYTTRNLPLRKFRMSIQFRSERRSIITGIRRRQLRHRQLRQRQLRQRSTNDVSKDTTKANTALLFVLRKSYKSVWLTCIKGTVQS